MRREATSRARLRPQALRTSPPLFALTAPEGKRLWPGAEYERPHELELDETATRARAWRGG